MYVLKKKNLLMPYGVRKKQTYIYIINKKLLITRHTNLMLYNIHNVLTSKFCSMHIHKNT